MYAFGSSAVACGAERYVTASMKLGPSPARPARDRLPRGLVDGEHVTAVDPRAGDAVAGRLVDQRLCLRLRRERCRDRPLVVVAEEDERRAHHGGEVRAFVEGTLGGGAVAEERQRAGRLTAQPLAPGEPRCVRHLRRDRDADRGEVVVGGVPPAGRVPAPPGEDRRCRHAAQEPDRGLAVAREDPVLVLERMERAGLDRLVAPVDRVRADPALAVVDDGALVVRAQQHHRAIEIEQLLLADPLDLAVRNRVAVPDHTAEIALGGNGARHRGGDSTFQGRATARARTGSRPAKKSAAVGSTWTSTGVSSRVSPGGPNSQYLPAT